MENEILQNLEDVGYTGPLLDSTKLCEALQGGAKSPEFTGLVSWLTDQIGSFGGFDETVHPTSTPEDANSFLLELSTFLKELGCVNKKLTTGNVNQRLASIEAKNTLLEYLVVELMTCKILESKKADTTKSVQITISESITAKNMREMLTALRFQKPPENIAPELLFKKLHTKVSEVVKQVPKELIGKPLFFGELNNDQWEKLNKMQSDFNDEYTIRREMLLQRLDVTVNSFAWSERIRPKEDQLSKCYHSKRDAMKHDPDVTLANLLSAREDLAIIEKTSNASVRKNTRSAINKVIIGAVPDRGGRPCEQEPPPPEMPSWQKDRVQGPQGQRGGFGGGGGGRGGGGRGGGRGGGGSGGQGGGGGYRDNKSASSNFGQNFEQKPTSFGNLSFGNQIGSQAGGYGNKGGSSYSSSNFSGSTTPAYGNKNTGYGGNSSSSGYSNQSGGYGNQSSSYSNQGSGYSNQEGYDRKSGGGDYNKGGRGGRVQGGWNQGGDSNSSNYNKGGYNNRGQGQGGQRY